MAREISSWLSGPEPSESGTPGEGPAGYAGYRLGLPEYGSGSIARFGRRAGALLIDWLIGYGLAALAMTVGLVSLNTLSTAVLVVWFVLGVLSVRLFGFTPGQLVLGLMVVSVDGDGSGVGLGRALVRNILIVLVIPALFTDSDQRSLHDLASKTAVVRR
jgi:uncharacterized RDD family membrane protein YckC